MKDFEIFEEACSYLSQVIQEFKETISAKIAALENADWFYDKGRTRTCRPDENGMKKRCKAGVSYSVKVELRAEDAESIWQEFHTFFKDTAIGDTQRVSANEEIGRYAFIAENVKGDRIDCTIYLPGDWNIPQISLLLFVAPRYRGEDISVY